jgi:hypothetical protein
VIENFSLQIGSNIDIIGRLMQSYSEDALISIADNKLKTVEDRNINCLINVCVQLK